MLNIRTIILFAALLVTLVFAVPLVTARTEVVSNPASDSVIVPDHQDRYEKMNTAPIPAYRSPLDVCYDVPLSAAAACRLAEQAHSSRGSTDVTDPVVLSQLAKVRQATAKYHDVNVAIAAGYVPTDACDESADGGMGFHYFNPSLGMDAEVNLTTPEVLMFESVGGELRLVGVEYFVGVGAPDAPVPNPAPPSPILFGRAFDGPMPGHIPGMPPHYDLHVWVWQPNPSGMFAPWNPSVTCP